MPTKKQIDEAVAEFCADVIQEPLLHFSEADLQQLLAERLRQIPCLRRPVKTEVRRGLESASFYSTSLVHREYGAGENRRADIVVFDREDALKINRTNLDVQAGPGRKPRYVDCRFVFELGTEKTSNTHEHLEKDLPKVEAAKSCGYIIHFYRDPTKSTSAGFRGATEKKIQVSFREPVQNAWRLKMPQTRILAVLIRTERAAKKMCGKCEICIGPTEVDWRKVNVGNRNNITAAVKEVLGSA